MPGLFLKRNDCVLKIFEYLKPYSGDFQGLRVQAMTFDGAKLATFGDYEGLEALIEALPRMEDTLKPHGFSRFVLSWPGDR